MLNRRKITLFALANILLIVWVILPVAHNHDCFCASESHCSHNNDAEKETACPACYYNNFVNFENADADDGLPQINDTLFFVNLNPNDEYLGEYSSDLPIARAPPFLS